MSTADLVADREADRAMARPFRLGVLGVLILFVLLGGLLSAYGSGADRPEGVAERWLSDVGDTRRDGVKDKARDAAEETGPVALAASILPRGDTDGRAAFTDLEVGKAQHGGGETRVPFRLHQRVDGSSGPAIDGTIVLRRSGEDWSVVEVRRGAGDLEVPSEGGAPAAEAPLGLFVGAVLVACAIAGLCGLLVSAAGREADAAGPSSPR